MLFALPVGLVVGLSLGMLGAGGSMLTVPALVFLFGLNPNQATTASLVVVGVTALTGAMAHWRAGNVRPVMGAAFGMLGSAGSVLGSVANAASDPDFVLLGFAALMGTAATAMLLGQPRPTLRHTRDAATAARPNSTTSLLGFAKVTLAATVVGALTGFFGVGGGFLVVPALVLALGYRTATALGTSLVVITVNSGVALLPRLSTDPHVQNWPLITGFIVASVIGSLMGTGLATRIATTKLTTAFAVVLLAFAGGSAWQSLGHILCTT